MDHYDFPVDRELERGRISEDEHKAAMEYLRLRVAIFGMPHAGAASIYARVGGGTGARGTAGIPTDDEIKREMKTEGKYEKARNALAAHRRRLIDVVDNAVVFLRNPPPHHRDLLQEGLSILADTFGYRPNKAT